MDSRFETIRPYNDAETAAAMQRVSGSDMVPVIERYLYPDKEKGYLSSFLKDIKGVEDFQDRVMRDVMERVVYKTTQGLTIGGFDNLVNGDETVGKFLFLSTHRDIVLDPAFLQLIFCRHNIPTTEIAVGDNLLYNQDVHDMMSSNKMIIVNRSGSPREIYTSCCLMSEYIRMQVGTQSSSVWIAHRQGRTKDGHDATEQGVLKMLDMSGKGSFEENFAQIRIMPVAISYEYETCGALKALELYQKERNGGVYVKKPGEDLNSIIQGFVQQKGRVHIEFCKPVCANDLAGAEKLSKNDKFRFLADIVDERLMSAYRLWPSNYIAADLLEKRDRFAGKYTEEEKQHFLAHIDEETKAMPEEVIDRLLHIYAAHLG